MNNIPTLHSPPPTPPLGKIGDKDLIKNHDKRTWFFQLISLEGMQQFRFTGFCGLLKGIVPPRIDHNLQNFQKCVFNWLI